MPSTNPAQAAGAGEDINNGATKQDDSNSVSSVSGPASGSANGGEIRQKLELVIMTMSSMSWKN